jgi:hypothetical protein
VKEDNDPAFEDDVTSRVNTIDAGGVVGLSYSLGNARHGEGIFLHARYAFGLTDIVKENPGDAVRNSVFQFAVSLPFVNPPQQE